MAKKKSGNAKEAIERVAINIVDTERTNWQRAVCFVTERVAFNMREMIRTLRKNYWGVFDEPVDPTTNREKIWIHLAMSIAEDIVKNVDLDQKDVGFRAKNPKGYAFTELVRAVVRDYLADMNFGEILDETERQLVVDGTVVWKTWEVNGELKRRTVDLLHVYIDPTEDNIQDAYRFTERALLTPDQVKGMSGWMNTDMVAGSTSLSRNDSEQGSSTGSPTTGKFVDVWEMWGKIPKYLITGKKEDESIEIDGHIIVSGLESGQPLVHLIEQNDTKDDDGNILKPYEELRAAKISGRWYGLGFVERILALQEWLNTTINLRINKGYVSQLGLFKIKKGAGITPQQLRKLPSNGAIAVNNMDDIDNFLVAPIDPTSYKDEEVIKEWAIKVTGAYPISSGESLPASTSATAAAIQNTNAKSSYSIVKDAIGFFLKRWMDRHALPVIGKTIKKEDLVRIMSDYDNYKNVVERIAHCEALEELSQLDPTSDYIPNDMEIQAMVDRKMEKLIKTGDLFFKIADEVFVEHLDTEVRVTNEDLDTSVTVTNLIQMMGIAPEYREPFTKQIFDLLGLDMPQLPKPTMQESAMPQDAMQPPTPQSITTNAMTQ